MELESRNVVRLEAGEGWTHRTPDGEVVTRKVESGQTGGAYSLFEVEVRPGGGSSSHIQHREDECLYVLDGRFELTGDDGGATEAGPGSLVYTPRGELHAYRNIGATTGRILMIHTPGGPHERFFEEVEGANGTVDAERISGFAAAHGIEVVAPFVPRNVPAAEGQNRGRRDLTDGTPPLVEYPCQTKTRKEG